MKTPSQNFIVRGTVYPYDVMFSINQSHEKLIKELLPYHDNVKENARNLILSGVGRTIQTHNNQIIVILKELDDTAQFHGNVSHEIFHACSYILDTAGVKHSVEYSEEAYAYLIGWMTQEFYRKLKTKK